VQQVSLTRLKWLAVTLPLAFLVLADYVRHTWLPDEQHEFPGVLVDLAVVAVATVVFSLVVFGATARLQRRVLEQGKQLGERLQEMAVMEERERIAREMHDGLAQVLVYISTQARTIRHLLASGRLPEAEAQLSDVEEAARYAQADVREAILGLRVSPPRQGGLLASLGSYIQRYGEMAGLETELRIGGRMETLRWTSSTEIQLMRIVQEALSNARKHARAAKVVVSLEATGDALAVEVADDGLGFDPGRLPPIGRPRFGLQTMRERAQAIGGRLDIQSQPGRGTRVVLMLPLQEAGIVVGEN